MKALYKGNLYDVAKHIANGYTLMRPINDVEEVWVEQRDPNLILNPTDEEIKESKREIPYG